MDLKYIIKTYQTILKRTSEADTILLHWIKEKSPNLRGVYDDWRSIKRNIHCPAMTSMWAEHYCFLEGEPYTVSRKNIAFFAGAAARISDDLTDSREVKPEEVFLLDSRKFNYATNNMQQQLFYSFNRGLEELMLSTNFKTQYKETIDAYNKAQLESLKLLLSPCPTPNEIIRIKNNTGGYPALLLYAMTLLPENDPVVGFEPTYDANNRIIPESKTEAIFNMGVFISHWDDLYDAKIDIEDGIRSLVTEGILDEKSARKEADYVEECLRKFYPQQKVATIFKEYRACMTKTTRLIDSVLSGA
jgi:hypothetical protein